MDVVTLSGLDSDEVTSIVDSLECLKPPPPRTRQGTA
jgi:hypothetical protein